MFKRVLFAAALVGWVAIPITNASAEGMPKHVQNVLARLEGKWVADFEGDAGTSRSEMTFEFTPAKKKCMLLRASYSAHQLAASRIGFGTS